MKEMGVLTKGLDRALESMNLEQVRHFSSFSAHPHSSTDVADDGSHGQV